MSFDIGTSPIPIPASDGVVCSYGGATVVNVMIEIPAAGPNPAADLLLYDSPSAASGNLIAVIPATGPNGIYIIKNKAITGIYAANTSNWVGTIWLGAG